MELNKSAYQRGPVDESGLRGLMNGEMNMRASSYKICADACSTLSLEIQSIESKTNSAKGTFSDGFTKSEGRRDKILAMYDDATSKAKTEKNNLRDREAIYRSAMNFYQTLISTCNSKINEANAKVQQLMQEKNEDGEPKYGNFKVKYSINGEEVTYAINYSGSDGEKFDIITKVR